MRINPSTLITQTTTSELFLVLIILPDEHCSDHFLTVIVFLPVEAYFLFKRVRPTV